jgi:hypothetical protein
MCMQSGQVMRTMTASHVEHTSVGLDSDVQHSLSSKGRKRCKPVSEDYEYSQLSDPVERKLEKRRAKNRRTAQVSRQRKEAEFSRMATQLEEQANEVARLNELILLKDQQIVQMMTVSSSSRSAPVDGGQSKTQKGSESAVFKTLYHIAKSLLTKRIALLKTLPPSCLKSCTPPSSGDELIELRRQVRELFLSMPECERRPLYEKVHAVMMGLLHHHHAMHERPASGEGEVSDECDV